MLKIFEKLVRERERDRNSPPPTEQISDKKGSKYFLKKFCRWLWFHHPLLRSSAIHLVLFITFFQLVLTRSFNQQFSLRTLRFRGREDCIEQRYHSHVSPSGPGFKPQLCRYFISTAWFVDRRDRTHLVIKQGILQMQLAAKTSTT